MKIHAANRAHGFLMDLADERALCCRSLARSSCVRYGGDQCNKWLDRTQVALAAILVAGRSKMLAPLRSSRRRIGRGRGRLVRSTATLTTTVVAIVVEQMKNGRAPWVGVAGRQLYTHNDLV